MENNVRFIPVKRTALDDKTWWVVYDLEQQAYSTLLYFGKYRTKKACQLDIDYYVNYCAKGL